MNDHKKPLHARVERADLRVVPSDPTSLPACRLELMFTLRAEWKHMTMVFYEVAGSSAGARDGARILARAAARFALTCEAFADADTLDIKVQE